MPKRAGDMNEPEEIFDFHGMTTSECKLELEEIVRSGEYSHIRIVVGRGIRSQNGPVLPDFVRNFLRDHDIHFSSSLPQDGGEGALEVFLR